MKYILFILLLACGCGKAEQEKECYWCTFGVQAPPKQVCINEGERIEDVDFKDDQGNELTSYCQKQ